VGKTIGFPKIGWLGYPNHPKINLLFEEILVEKLRSLHQRARARDYYDIYRLLNHGSFDSQQISTAVERKAAQQDVALDLETGIPEGDAAAVDEYWAQALDRLATDKPAFEDVVSAINSYLSDLSESC